MRKSYTMILTDQKPKSIAENEIWIQSAYQAIECINEKGIPTLFKVGDSLGVDLFNEPLPNVSDFFEILQSKIDSGAWRYIKYSVESLN